MNEPHTRKNLNIGIIGGGITGLTAAYKLSKRGLPVTVIESEKELGGLAASFNVGQQPLERFYHHVFKTDQDFISLVDELNLSKDLEFTKPLNAIFYQKQLYPFSTPLDLLKFTPLSLSQRLQTGYNLLYLKNSSWRNLDNMTAAEWLSFYFGDKAYRILWEPLLIGKFGEHASQISLPWFWSRLISRTPELGYLKGGFQKLIAKLSTEITNNHGKINTGETAVRIVNNGRSTDLETSKNTYRFSHLLVTTAPAIFSRLLDNQKPHFQQQFLNQQYFGNVCLVLSLTKRLTDYYWINIHELGSPFTALIEHTNFQSSKLYNNQNLIYLTRYTSVDSEVYTTTKQQLFKRSLPWLTQINPRFNNKWVKDLYLFRASHSQPIVHTNYVDSIPPIETPFPNVYFASMAQIYPYDRGMNYAISMANQSVKYILGANLE